MVYESSTIWTSFGSMNYLRYGQVTNIFSDYEETNYRMTNSPIGYSPKSLIERTKPTHHPCDDDHYLFIYEHRCFFFSFSTV